MASNRDLLRLRLEQDRRQSRADLFHFAQRMFWRRKGFAWQEARHHRLICDALMRVFNGECRRLVINVPPRYSKTELAVVNFIAWALGKVPDAEFIHASYSGALAGNNSANVRELVQHEAYLDIFPGVELASDAQHHWKTTAGGVMYAVGAGGTITGFGAGKHREGFGGAIIIDDPHKADEARSDVIRQGVVDWFQNTLESRQNAPGRTPIILIMQRLHEKDLAGWLLGGGNGETWEHICLPAITDDGQALWPEKHDMEALRRMERAAPYVFAGQYLQRPAPPQGGVFKPDQLQVVDALPAGPIEWARGWDLAATAESARSPDPDYTAGGRLGRLQDGRFVIADMVRLRAGPDERDAALRNTAARDGNRVRQSLPQDPGQAGKTQALHLTRMLAGYPVHTSPESGDKVTRAEPLAAQVNVGNVLMVRGPWNDELIAEMRLFPNGTHDDQIDALSRASEALMGGNTGMLDWARQQTEQQQQRKAQPA
jgi:predicted phage terminase large subunit-like protein